ncbi:MAG: precorrin-8X methylmutase, partial [Clostridiales bacterium]|nr:precorrin-8X methylmutase [Clostridiales bacterium]
MQRYDHGGDIYAHQHIRLDFSANINPLGMPPAVKEAVIRHVDSYAVYPDPRCRALCAAIARHEGMLREYVLCGNGAADLIMRLCLSVKPRRALICAPSFSEYEKAVLLTGGGIHTHTLLEENGFLPDEELLDAILPDVDAVFLCNPNNPTGRLFPEGLLHQVLARCEKQGALLVVDECFLEFSCGVSLKPWLRAYKNLVILRAFTKTYAMAGLRLGYLLCADETLLRSIESCGQSWGVSAVAQCAGLAALTCEGWMRQTRALIKGERAYLQQGLRALNICTYPSDANFLLLYSKAPLHDRLLRRGILIRPCGNYTGLNDSYCRVAVRARKENEELLAALSEVLRGKRDTGRYGAGDDAARRREPACNRAITMDIEMMPPDEIEAQSFAIIESGLPHALDPALAPVIKRVIHATADFDYADTLCFSDAAINIALAAIKSGANIVTDTNMAKAGVNKKELSGYGGEVLCYMADADIAQEAKRKGITRAAASMDKAAQFAGNAIFAIGNAPTALLRLYELIRAGRVSPALVIGVPVGFVNVAQAKELIMTAGVAYIVAKGKKG